MNAVSVIRLAAICAITFGLVNFGEVVFQIEHIVAGSEQSSLLILLESYFFTILPGLLIWFFAPVLAGYIDNPIEEDVSRGLCSEDLLTGLTAFTGLSWSITFLKDLLFKLGSWWYFVGTSSSNLSAYTIASIPTEIILTALCLVLTFKARPIACFLLRK